MRSYWRFLLPKQLTQNGLSKVHVQATDPVLLSIVTPYTQEAGVCALERAIGGGGCGVQGCRVGSPCQYHYPQRHPLSLSYTDAVGGLDKSATNGDAGYDPC
jgi:hypothetical protein